MFMKIKEKLETKFGLIEISYDIKTPFNTIDKLKLQKCKIKEEVIETYKQILVEKNIKFIEKSLSTEIKIS